MQNSLQRGPPVLMEADNFVLNLAVSIWWIKLYCRCYFPINYFDFMKEEILVCFLPNLQGMIPTVPVYPKIHNGT